MPSHPHTFLCSLAANSHDCLSHGILVGHLLCRLLTIKSCEVLQRANSLSLLNGF